MELNKLFESYNAKMNNTEWRYENRESVDWFVKIDVRLPDGQCGPIYRPMNKIEFENKCSVDDHFKNLWK